MQIKSLIVILLKHIVLPALVLVPAIMYGLYLFESAPKIKRKIHKPIVPIVEVLQVQPTTYQVTLESQGSVAVQKKVELIAQVEGQITFIAQQFYTGEKLTPSTEIIRIDSTDYEYAKVIAQSEQSKAELALIEEQAAAKQAVKDWQRTGLSGKPTDLTMRLPQLAYAESSLAASKAKVKQAQANLERTKVIAPYSGWLVNKSVETGEFVTKGKKLATLYADYAAEVKLPVTEKDQQMLIADDKNMLIEISTADNQLWQGRISRTEVEVDAKTQQYFLIVEVENAFPKLKVNQFVRAKIQGKELENVFIIPRGAVRNSGEVLLVSQKHGAELQQVSRRKITPIWQDENSIIISSGLQSGDRVVISPIAYAPEGMQVKEITAR